MLKRRFGACGSLLFALLLAACTPVGPRALSEGRPLYNEAVQQTEAQQLLLNIVRQRYSDPVLFLDVTSIASGYAAQANAAWSSRVFESVTETASGSLGGTLRESPNIFYAPNTGEDFVRQMLTPLEIETIALILQSGWSIERVLMLSGESMNSLRNSTRRQRPGSPGHGYGVALQALRELQRDGELVVGAAPGGDGGLALLVAPRAVESDAYQTACALLDLVCDGRPIELVQALGGAGEGERLSLATRSLFSTLYYLAQAVDVPQRDLRDGVTYATSPTDLNEELFVVHSSLEEPERAAVKIRYRDAWFYIADDDLDSKTPFALLSMLLTLQSGDVATMAPLLTLPAQ